MSFLTNGQFDGVMIAANDIICSTSSEPGWRACESGELQPRVRSLVRGKVVIIGEDVPDIDRHKTVVGDVAGFVLQADYVESLLDNRLIHPVSDIFNWTARIGHFCIV